MQIKIKKLHPAAQLPMYATAGAAGFDLHALDYAHVERGEVTRVRTGLAMVIPEGHYLAIVPRSGLAAKHGVRVVNAPGTVDADYRGEILVLLTSDRDSLHVQAGERIAQAILKRYERAEFVEVDELDDTERGAGGFGSTGV